MLTILLLIVFLAANKPAPNDIWIKTSEYEKLVNPYIIEKTNLEEDETGYFVNAWLIHASNPSHDITDEFLYIGKVTRTSKNTIFTYENIEIAPTWKFKKVPSWWRVDIGYDVYRKPLLPISGALRSEDVYIFISDDRNDIYISHQKRMNAYGH